MQSRSLKTRRPRLTVPWSAAQDIHFYDRMIVVNRPGRSCCLFVKMSAPGLPDQPHRRQGTRLSLSRFALQLCRETSCTVRPTRGLRSLPFALDRPKACLRRHPGEQPDVKRTNAQALATHSADGNAGSCRLCPVRRNRRHARARVSRSVAAGFARTSVAEESSRNLRAQSALLVGAGIPGPHAGAYSGPLAAPQ